MFAQFLLASLLIIGSRLDHNDSLTEGNFTIHAMIVPKGQQERVQTGAANYMSP